MRNIQDIEDDLFLALRKVTSQFSINRSLDEQKTILDTLIDEYLQEIHRIISTESEIRVREIISKIGNVFK